MAIMNDTEVGWALHAGRSPPADLCRPLSVVQACVPHGRTAGARLSKISGRPCHGALPCQTAP